MCIRDRYILDDNGVKSECVITGERNGVLEIKNIATVPEYQGKGYAKASIDFIIEKYSGQYAVLQVGTGDLSLIHLSLPAVRPVPIHPKPDVHISGASGS